jgi:hypothetical protein
MKGRQLVSRLCPVFSDRWPLSLPMKLAVRGLLGTSKRGVGERLETTDAHTEKAKVLHRVEPTW